MEPVPAAKRPTRFHLRVEDVILFLWLVLRPLFVPDRTGEFALPGYDPLGGLFDLLALCAAAACVLARRRDSIQTGLIREQDVAYAVGPLFGALAFALDDCVNRLGLANGAETLPLVLPVGAAVAARIWLPPTTIIQRRALVTPFILATSGFFNDFLSGLTDIFDLRHLRETFGAADLGLSLSIVALAILGIAVFYLMLVFAPRQIAEREGTGRTWTIRFVVFVVGLSLGATLAGVVHGT